MPGWQNVIAAMDNYFVSLQGSFPSSSAECEKAIQVS